MNNHNVVFGLLLTQGDTRAFDFPEWASHEAHIDVNTPLLAEGHISGAAHALSINGRHEIGAVIVDLGSTIANEAGFFRSLESLSVFFSAYTSFLFVGKSGELLELIDSLGDVGDEAIIRLRLYQDMHDSNITKAVLLIQSAKDMPLHRLDKTAPVNWSFKELRVNPSSFNGRAIPVEYALTESTPCKRPLAAISSLQLPREISLHISRTTELYHHVAIVPNGWVLPFQGQTYSTFAHATAEGEVLCDYGNEASALTKTPFWQAGREEANGTRHTTYELKNFIKIRGSAMPIQFTPNLHHWFSHFMIQCLPRLIILDELKRSRTKIIVPQDLRKKQIEMIISCGIQADRIVRVPIDLPWQAEELIVPLAWPLAFSEKTISIFDKLLAAYPVIKASKKRNLLISREMRKTWRNLINSKQVEDALVSKEDFVIVRPELLSLEHFALARNRRVRF